MNKQFLFNLMIIFTNILWLTQTQAEEVLSASTAPIPAATYTLDKTHASLTFSVNHIGFSNYTMSFDDFDVVLKLDPENLANASVIANIDPRSLDLPSPPQGFTDSVLGDNWLNATRFPKIVFTSTKVETTGDNIALVYGNLELLAVKKAVVLDVTFNGGYAGHVMDPQARVGFSARANFKRSDFGMHYGIPAPGTTMGVGDVITVVIEAEFNGPPMAESSTQSAVKKRVVYKIRH